MYGLRRAGLALFSLLLAVAAGATAPPTYAAALQTDASQAIEQGAAEAMPATPPLDLDDLEHRTFEFFWQTANPKNGLVPDHWPLGKEPFASIAAVGFALTAYPIGVER
ncbi:MAG TPA: Tat pathway signal protein, partial [Rhodanobacteraceae bacterium]|nr:Tat pathway signal protein [Rhodanobacteraceae bacterium]